MQNFFKNSKIIKLLFFILLLIFLLFIVFLDKFFQLAPYQQIKIIYDKSLNKIVSIKNNSLKECNIPSLNNIPNSSTVLIGHAYGSPNNSRVEDFISEKVLNFLQINSKNIDKVIFTGDVFSVPTITKWIKLENTFKNKFEIHIAPGNHDILGSSAKEIFLQSKFGSSNYPYKINFNDSMLIIEDSISTSWNISKETISKIKKSDKKLNFIARHNIPIEELKAYVNSVEGKSKNFINFNKLKKLIPEEKKIVWIIGDSGAFKSLPRIKCFQKNNHKFVLNGIGDIENDTVTLINQNKLYSYEIN